jgi:3-oxoacyl-[acyl-carrier-protein] synthase II
MNTVVVTGLGLVSPLGQNAPDSWRALQEGRSGIAPISLFDTEGHDCRIAGEVKDWDAGRYMERKEARRSDRFTQFAYAAALEAIAEARLRLDEEDRTQVGCLIGSAIGGIGSLSEQFAVLHEKGPGRVSPFLIPMMLPDMASGALSISLGIQGVNLCLVSACASGADAIGEAAEMIRRGELQVALAGGSEAPITAIGLAGFTSMKALSLRNDEPQAASRPFDATRDGFVMAEGAGVLVLESLEHARARGANIVCELAGYGATSDAYHITQPAEKGEGATRAIRRALQQAGLQPEQIGYINAHGTSTPANDKFETMAVKGAFGEAAGSVPMSSTKSMLGHMLGAAGAAEAVISVLALRDGVMPPTINLNERDPECDLDYVPNAARKKDLRAVMSNSMGFGGHNTSLIFRKLPS